MKFDADALQDVAENVGKVAQNVQNGMESIGKRIGTESSELFNALKDKVTDFVQRAGDTSQDGG